MKNNRRVWIWIALVLGAAALIGLAFWLDGRVEAWALDHQMRKIKRFTRVINKWGDWPYHVVVGFIGAGVAWVARSKNWTRIFLSMLVACAVAGAVAKAIQFSIERPRPITRVESKPITPSRLRSFPSGHTTASVAFFAARVFASWRIGLAFLLIPVAIAFSRVYAGAHHLSDVVAGALLALLVAWIVRKMMFREVTSAG